MAVVLEMGATCIGLMEEVDALGGDVHGPVEERHPRRRGWRPDIKEIEIGIMIKAMINIDHT